MINFYEQCRALIKKSQFIKKYCRTGPTTTKKRNIKSCMDEMGVEVLFWI